MPRITCPYCKVQYGHEWWCWFKRMMYRKPNKKWQKMSKSWDELAKPIPLSDMEKFKELMKNSQCHKSFRLEIPMTRIGCHICGKFVELKYPTQKPSHTMFCWWKRLQMKLRGE